MKIQKNSLDELEELAQTAGAETVGRIIQNREQIHPGTYVGKGKLDEIKNSPLGDRCHWNHL